MIFRQVFDNKSSTYTYLIASAKGREALIIDPVIENVENYIELLNELDLKLVKVIDTHIHADHITGASKLKQATNWSTLMGEHTPADAVEIKVKEDKKKIATKINSAKQELTKLKFCVIKIIVSKIILVINPLMIAKIIIPKTGKGIWVN